MREHSEEICSKGVSIIAVTPAKSNQLKQFSEVFGSYPFMILGDPDRHFYKELSLNRLSIMSSLAIISNYLFSGRLREIFPKDSEKRKVVKKAMASQDVYQLGGTFLINPKEKVLWQDIDSEPADHAAIPEILSVLERLNERKNSLKQN